MHCPTLESLIEVLGWSSRGGSFDAKKIGGADAFGCDERTPSLPYAANEDPRLELHPHFDEAIALELYERLLAVAPPAPRLRVLERFEERKIHVDGRGVETRVAHRVIGLRHDHR